MYIGKNLTVLVATIVLVGGCCKAYVMFDESRVCKLTGQVVNVRAAEHEGNSTVLIVNTSVKRGTGYRPGCNLGPAYQRFDELNSGPRVTEGGNYLVPLVTA